jgi:hypothetical protein
MPLRRRFLKALLLLLPLFAGSGPGQGRASDVSMADLRTRYFCLRGRLAQALRANDGSHIPLQAELNGLYRAQLDELALEETYYCPARLSRNELEELKAGGTQIAFEEGASLDDQVFYAGMRFPSLKPGDVVHTELRLARAKPENPVYRDALEALEPLYRTYRESGALPEPTVAQMILRDQKLDPLRASFIVMKSQDGKPAFTLRLYDGSEKVLVRYPKERFAAIVKRELAVDSSAALPAELNHPDLKLPKSGYRLELGRSGKDREEILIGDLHSLFARAGHLLQATYSPRELKKVTLYAETLEPMLQHYTGRHGFELIAGTRLPPEGVPASANYQILSLKDEAHRFILKISAGELIDRNTLNRMFIKSRPRKAGP